MICTSLSQPLSYTDEATETFWRCPLSLLFSKNPYLVDVGYRASLRERLYIFPSQPRLIFRHLQVYSLYFPDNEVGLESAKNLPKVES